MFWALTQDVTCSDISLYPCNQISDLRMLSAAASRHTLIVGNLLCDTFCLAYCRRQNSCPINFQKDQISVAIKNILSRCHSLSPTACRITAVMIRTGSRHRGQHAENKIHTVLNLFPMRFGLMREPHKWYSSSEITVNLKD